MSEMSGAADFRRRVAEYNERQADLAAGRPVIPAVPPLRENARYPARIVAAALAGTVAVLLSRYIRHHLTGTAVGGEGADITMMIDGALAGAAGFVIRQIFKFEAKVFLTSFNVGVAAMIVLMHNLVHAAPGLFTVVFSEDWVEQVVTETEPNSVFFMGDSIPLSGGDGGKSPKMPRRFQVGE